MMLMLISFLFLEYNDDIFLIIKISGIIGIYSWFSCWRVGQIDSTGKFSILYIAVERERERGDTRIL